MRRLLPLIVLLSCLPVSAGAGVIVASGDTTPSFYVSDLSPDLATAGNQAFFANVLGSGQRVALYGSNLYWSPELLDFYGSLPGVTASVVSDPLDAAQLTDVDLLLVSPDYALTADEILSIGSFVDTGGSLFVMGEGVLTDGTVPGNIANTNAILAGIGSGMRLNEDGLDNGAQVATGSHIVVDPLTAGVGGLTYGKTSTVDGGTPLFLASTGAPFMAYEQILVPEPSTLVLVLAGLAAACRPRRSRSQRRRSAPR